MDDLVELEDHCVFCSKYLAGMHEFNKKMHYNTCKMRKLFDSVYTSSSSQTDPNDMDDFLIMGDNCNFCYKSLKDFKSEYNKRIHVKCCKIKKETFDRRDSIIQLQQQTEEHQSPSTSSQTQTNDNVNPMAQLFQTLTETCIFCTKPLGNLNSFNRKMHIEHCKIRKSLEGNLQLANKNKDENLVGTQDTTEIGDHCIYCNKSFARLSAFNRRLHSDHCKSKKRKLKALNQVFNNSINLNTIQTNDANYGQNLSQVQNNLILMATNSCPSTPIRGNHTVNLTQQQDTTSSQETSLNQSQLGIDSNELCIFCSRSLSNLSNFNKNIHIEQCKLKQMKKANADQLKQTSKPARKRAKTSNQLDKDKNNEFCTTQILTQLDLSGANDLTSSTNSNNNSSLTNNGTGNQNHQSLTSTTQITQINQFDPSNTTILSLNQLDNTTLQQLSLAASQAASQNILNSTTHTLQITLDPNTNRIYL